MKLAQKIGLALGIGYLFVSFKRGTLKSPVSNFKIRDCDANGCGHYGASRLRKGISVKGAHKGIDVVVTPGENVYAPISGTVRTLFVNPGSTAMRGIEIKNNNMAMKIFYMVPHELETGETILAGEYMGVAQNVASYYNAPAMTPHIHVELRINGESVDPTGYFG